MRFFRPVPENVKKAAFTTLVALSAYMSARTQHGVDRTNGRLVHSPAGGWFYLRDNEKSEVSCKR